jgi:hypothetical protein
VISPVALTLNAGEPGGRPVAPQLLLGMAWFAVIWYEKGTPTWPVALPLIMFGAFAAKAIPERLMARALPSVIAASRQL